MTVQQVPQDRTVTPLALAIINGKRFALTKGRITQNAFGIPSQLDISLPADQIDSATLQACWSNPTQFFDVYMGTRLPGQNAVLDFVETGMCDSVGSSYSTTEGEILDLSGPDCLGLFSQTEIKPLNYMNSHSSDIAVTWAQNHDLVPHVTFTTAPISNYYQQDTSYLTAVTQTQLDLLVWLAKLEAYAFYTHGHDFFFGPVIYGPTFDLYYKVPGKANTVFDLSVTRHPRANKNITVIVQTYDRHNKKNIVTNQFKGGTGPYMNKGEFQVPTGNVGLLSGGNLQIGSSSPNLVEQVGAADGLLTVTITTPHGSNAAYNKKIGQAKIMDLLRSEVTIQATAPGNTQIQRNSKVIVHSGYLPQEAISTFYVSSVTHDFSPDSGFTTQFTATNFPYGFIDINQQ